MGHAKGAMLPGVTLHPKPLGVEVSRIRHRNDPHDAPVRRIAIAQTLLVCSDGPKRRVGSVGVHVLQAAKSGGGGALVWGAAVRWITVLAHGSRALGEVSVFQRVGEDSRSIPQSRGATG